MELCVFSSGEEWRKIRSQLNHSLMKPRQLQRYMSDLSQVAQDLANKLGTVRDQNTNDNTVPNILNVLYSWSIESKYDSVNNLYSCAPLANSVLFWNI